ncbi:immunoglobulin lambda-1 light chain-like isoform X1 [Eublepharis macularius]|uniref:immunoglobulin lambda-1 light chain-like isoform X1 n=1 Tax=Eublepharis macularius TaxID=481883 RepID=UPI00240F5199|nr:immunoglobulin lambda-1 light chain-like isoform X1 [Eublepharis macularius]
MAWTLFFFTFLACYAGSNSQYTLTQPSTESASLGQSIKLSCTMSQDSNVNSYTISWYQQRAEEAPRLVLYGTSSRGEGIPDRFTGSKDSSANAAYLTITGIQAEDEAVYFCAGAYSGSSWRYIFGGGTQLSVLGQPASRPTMNVFPPSQEELRTTDKATLACLVSDFMPGAAQVIWLADGSPISSGVETTKPTKHNDKYMLSSYLTMPSSEWEKHNEYTCKVTHEGSEYRKTVNRSQ